MNLNCSNQDPCPVILDSKCVIYEGENLLYIGVSTNDNFRFALEQINSVIGTLILSGGITQLLGDVVAYGPGVATATLAIVNNNVGQFGSSTAIPKITVNAKGLVTAISTDPIFIPSGALNFIGDVTGVGNTGADTTLTLATVNPNVGSYGSGTHIPTITVNGKGLITSASETVIPLANTTINGLLTAVDWNTFNNKQTAGNYITDLNGEVSGTGPGIANVIVNNAAVTGKVLSGVNITGGSISDTDSILTAFGKVQNQINGLIGGSIYKGVWNATTNSPVLTSGVGTQGWYYIVNVPGTTNLDGYDDWGLGDWAIFDGTAWQQVDNTDAVVSVNGFTGAVSLTTDNISEGLTNRYFTNTRARHAVSAGTGLSYDDNTGIFASTITQYTDVLARGAISAGSGITYDNVSGVITNSAPDQTVTIGSGTGMNVTGTYPNFTVTTTITQYTDALARGAISLTTTGTSGAATYNSSTGILNIPQYQGGVTSFNTRTGAITLTSSDVTTALGYTPLNGANAITIQTYLTIGLGGGGDANSVSIGRNAMGSNTGTRNIAIGYSTLNGSHNGSYDTAIGFAALGVATSGGNNTAIGGYAGSTITSGANNVIISGNTGIVGGIGVTTGSNNTIVGQNISGLATTLSNNIILADGAGNIKFQWDGTNIKLNGSIVGSNAYTSTAFTPQTRTLTINGTTYDLTADRSWTIGTTILNGTGFVKASGTTISYDNSTYYLASNPSGYITGITSGNVTTALGYTPYNSTNPNGYITSSGSISGSAGSISNFTASISTSPVNADAPSTINTIGYCTSVSLFGQSDGGLYTAGYGTAWYHQIFGDFRTGQLAVRGKNSNTWQAWRTILDASNSAYAYNMNQYVRTTDSPSWQEGTFGTTAGSSNQGIQIHFANATGGYGRIRFYENDSNSQTIHCFSTGWQGGGFGSTNSANAINIAGGAGVTFGSWNICDAYIQTGGTGWFRGNVIAYSDGRVKENIRSIDNALSRILNSRGVLYDRIDIAEKNNIGFIAQELEVTFPELVMTGSDGMKSVNYQNMSAVFVEGFKEQQTQIEELKTEVKELKVEIKELKSRI